MRASQESYGSVAWTAFNKRIDNKPVINQAENTWTAENLPAWLRIDYPRAMQVLSYSISSWTRANRVYFPVVWRLEGSNDGTVWSTLGTYSLLDNNNTFVGSWAAGETKTFTVPHSHLFSKFRLYLINSVMTNDVRDVRSDFHVAISEWRLNPNENIQLQFG